MDKLSTKLKLVRSQSMGVGMGSTSTMSAPSTGRSNGHLESGRNASIVLLDERRLELVIQPRLYAGELLDLVSSHCGLLKEKEYFGLALVDDHGLYTWLTLDRKVLDHDLPRSKLSSSSSSVLTIHFLVKFFIESISHLTENKTVELFYLQARSLIFRGSLEVEADIVFQLAALTLQASASDYVDDIVTRALIKKSAILPASVLKEHSSLTYCEDRVIEHYKKTRGQTRGQAMVNYMTIVESMPTYGVHYFEVLDKRQNPWWLGLSCKGIAQYGYNDRKVPVRVFQWKQLENLYFRDKKFSIEVHDAKRVVQTPSSVNLYEDALKLDTSAADDRLIDAINNDSTTRVSTSRRSFNPGSIHVYVWFGKTQGLTKCIWQSAISQHQFYLDRKQAKLRHHAPPRSLKEIARDLTRSTASLSSASSLSNLSRHSSTSTHSLATAAALSGGAVGGGGSGTCGQDEISEETRRARMEMLAALRARKEALDSKLKEKNKLLKELCVREAELTGEIPPEMPLNPGEALPVIRRRVGTEFALNSETLFKKCRRSPEEDLLANLELEREIQTQITNAALKISNDASASKSVRKQRKISYQQSQRKLKEIESKLKTLKMHMASSNTMTSLKKKQQLRRGLSVPDLEMNGSTMEVNGQENQEVNGIEDEDDDDEDGAEDDNDDEEAKEEEEEEEEEGEEEEDDYNRRRSPRSCPTSPRKYPSARSSDSISLDPSSRSSPQRATRTGYITSSVYLRSSYRAKQYPTLSSDASNIRHHHHPMPVPTPDMVLGSAMSPPYRNKFELNSQCDSPVGLYNCPQQRTSQAFSSLDDLDALQQQQQQLQQQQQALSPVTRLEAAAGNYPSLERSARRKKKDFSHGPNVSSASLFVPPHPPLAHPPSPLPPPLPPPKEIRRSLEDVNVLEAAGVHGRSKMRYREVNKEDAGEFLPGTNNWHRGTDGGGPYPLPPTVNRTTLLPGQTYPDPQPANGPLNMVASIQEVLFTSSSRTTPTKSEDPPPLFPKQYHQVIEQRRRSGLSMESPAVNRKMKPTLSTPTTCSTTPSTTVSTPMTSVTSPTSSNTSFCETVIPAVSSAAEHTPKYVPYRETTKPFEMSDFYKYSTKFRKGASVSSLKSGESSSDQSSTTSSSSHPPEIPARSVSGPPPAVPPPVIQTAHIQPTSPKLSAQGSNSSLADAFSSEMLAWYNNQKQKSGSSGGSGGGGGGGTGTTSKPATLV